MEQFACPLCGGKDSKLAFSASDFDRSVDSFELLQCTRCGLTQTWPIPDTVSLEQSYSNSYYGRGPEKFSGLVEFLTVLGNRFRAHKILGLLPRHRGGQDKIRVLDVGCGRANLLFRLHALGCECVGTERSSYPSHARAGGVTIHQQALEDIKLDDSYFDAVVIWHVLEHLPRPLEALEEVRRVLREGGLIAIAVPNFSSLQARIFKSRWFHLDLPRHLYHFNIECLGSALTQKGYEIRSVSNCSLEQNLFGFVQSLMNCLKFTGKQNHFYQLLKNRSGLIETLELTGWALIALLILPFALLEFIVSCVLHKGASLIIFAHKA